MLTAARFELGVLCTVGAGLGFMFDIWSGVWGLGLIVGALAGWVIGRQRSAAARHERELAAHAADGLKGLYEPEPYEDWELEEEAQLKARKDD